VIEFVDHLQIATLSNYRALASSCTRLLTTAQSKCSQFVLASRCLITDPNNVLCLRPYWLANISQLTKLSLSLILRPTVSRPVCLRIKHPSGATTRFLFLSDSCGLVDVGCFLGREDRSVVYNCCWPSPEQSFRVRVPWDSWPYITVCSLTLMTPRHGLRRKHRSFLYFNGRRNMFVSESPHLAKTAVYLFIPRSLPSRRSCLWSHYLATGLHGTILSSQLFPWSFPTKSL
jgi:hypothetical protein